MLVRGRRAHSVVHGSHPHCAWCGVHKFPQTTAGTILVVQLTANQSRGVDSVHVRYDLPQGFKVTDGSDRLRDKTGGWYSRAPAPVLPTQRDVGLVPKPAWRCIV